MTTKTPPDGSPPSMMSQLSDHERRYSDYYKGHMAAFGAIHPEDRRTDRQRAEAACRFDIQSEKMWGTLPAGCQLFLVETPHDVDLGKLLKFWSKHRDRIWIPKNSWHLASGYLYNRSTIQEANNLMLNAAFLEEAFCFPGSFIDEIAKRIRAVGLKNRRLDQHDIHQHVVSTLPHIDQAYNIRSDTDLMTHHFWRHHAKLHGQEEDCIGYVVEPHDEQGFDNATGEVQIVLSNEETQEECEMKIGPTTKLKKLFNDYADEKNLSLRSLRFSYKGRPLFLSYAGKMTPSNLDMNLKGLVNTIVVTDLSKPDSGNIKAPAETSSDKASQKKKKGKGKQKKKAQNRKQPLMVEKTEEELKIEHSKKLSKLHEEAQPQLKLIRQQLNNLLIERNTPKIRSKYHVKSASALPQPSIVNYGGLSGKAGKSRYRIQVGEIANLYKTSKPRCTQMRPIKLDLHGLTKEEALDSLDKKLPIWNEIAMSGLYPFVVPVEIICGKGSQVLSEIVKQWIRVNEQVANAVKSAPS